MPGFTCPYCSHVMSVSNDTSRTRSVNFEGDYRPNSSSWVDVVFLRCPNCDKFTIQLDGIGEKVSKIAQQVLPSSLAKQYPDYIPQAIRNDYEEAYAILNLSPKASATLARRCLQGMIHDFWGIVEKNLNCEITALKDKIPTDLWQSIDALREMGNIGAHMEKNTDVIVDIDPDEAKTLIQLIELLMKEWYINREERKKLFSDIVSANAEKQAQRRGQE